MILPSTYVILSTTAAPVSLVISKSHDVIAALAALATDNATASAYFLAPPIETSALVAPATF